MASVTFMFSGLQLPGNNHYPAQQFYAAAPPAQAGKIVGTESVRGFSATDINPRLSYRVAGVHACDRYLRLATRSGAICTTTSSYQGLRLGSCSHDDLTTGVQERGIATTKALGNERVRPVAQPTIDISLVVP